MLQDGLVGDLRGAAFIAVFAGDGDDNPLLNETLEAIKAVAVASEGASITPAGKMELGHVVRTRAELAITQAYARGIAKIAFHYTLAHRQKVFSGHEAVFDDVKRYIKTGDGFQGRIALTASSIVNEPLKYFTHIVQATVNPYEIIVRVQLFVGPAGVPPSWVVRLAANPSYIYTADLGHPLRPDRRGRRRPPRRDDGADPHFADHRTEAALAVAMNRRRWIPVIPTYCLDAADAGEGGVPRARLSLRGEGRRVAAAGIQGRPPGSPCQQQRCRPHQAFTGIAAAVEKLNARSLVLDGVITVFDDQLRSRFDWLRNPDPEEVAKPPVLSTFDLLYLNGRDICARPLRDRRARLEDVVAGSGADVPGAAACRRWPGGLGRGGDSTVRGLRGETREQRLRGWPTKRWVKVKQKG